MSYTAGADPFDDQSGRFDTLVQVIGNRVAEVEALLSRSRRENTALRTSCIEEKLLQLREKQRAAKSEAALFRGLRDKPVEQKRMIERSSVLEMYSAALVRDARSCKDAQITQTRLEVQYGSEKTPGGVLPGIDPVPPPRYDRPPLASPY